MSDRAQPSRRSLLRQMLGATLALPASGLLAACGATATPAATTSGTAATSASAAVTSASGRAATSAESSSTGTARATSTSASASLEAKVAKGTVWVTFWGTSADDQYMRAAADLFRKAGGAPVTVQNVTGDYVTALTTFMAAGTPPDVAIFTNDMVPDLLRQGAFTDMQPLIARDKVDTSDFVPAALQAYAFKGGQYALPKNFHSEAIWYNIERFHEVGVTPPDVTWTLDDYLQAAQKLTDSGKGLIGSTMPVSQFTLPWIWLYGGDIVNDSTNVTKITFSNPRTVQALQWVADLRSRYHVAPTTEQAAPTKGDTNMFYDGQVGMYPYLYIEGRMASFAKGFTWDVGPLPSGSGGKRATLIATGGWFLPKGSANPDLGWKFVQSATSPESMQQDAKIGIGIPARLSVTTWPQFQAGPPSHKNVFIEQAMDGRLAPVFPGVGAVLAAAWKALDPLFAGASTAPDAAARADAAANAELQKHLGQ